MVDPQLAAALLAALAQHMPQFVGPGGAPMQPDPASGALLPQGSVSPVPQGFGVGGFDGPLGDNAQLGWGTAQPFDYGAPKMPFAQQLGQDHQLLGPPIGPPLIHPHAQQRPAAARRGIGDFHHPTPRRRSSGPSRPPDTRRRMAHAAAGPRLQRRGIYS